MVSQAFWGVKAQAAALLGKKTPSGTGLLWLLLWASV
jgi:hypothetical protein